MEKNINRFIVNLGLFIFGIASAFAGEPLSPPEHPRLNGFIRAGLTPPCVRELRSFPASAQSFREIKKLGMLNDTIMQRPGVTELLIFENEVHVIN